MSTHLRRLTRCISLAIAGVGSAPRSRSTQVAASPVREKCTSICRSRAYSYCSVGNHLGYVVLQQQPGVISHVRIDIGSCIVVERLGNLECILMLGCRGVSAFTYPDGADQIRS